MIKHLAIVDDEDDFCQIVLELAKGIGYQVSTFNSSRDFLSSCKEIPYDLIILDIVMPDIDGMEIIRHLSKLSNSMNIILCSGYSEDYLDLAETLSSAGSLNIVSKIRKPVGLSDLEQTLKALYD